MIILSRIMRKLRLARLQDAIHRRNIIRHSYIEQVLGLNRDIQRLESAHLRDITLRGPTSREIARGLEKRAKAGLFA